MLDEIYEDVAELIKTNTDYPDRNLMDWLHEQRYDLLPVEQLALVWDYYDLYHEKYYLAIPKLNTWCVHEDLLFIDWICKQDFINLSPTELALMWDDHVYPHMEYDKIEFKVSKLCKTDKYKNNINLYDWLINQPYTDYTPEQLAQQWDNL